MFQYPTVEQTLENKFMLLIERFINLQKKKPINIYIGYDSNHDDIIHEVAEKSIHDSIEKSKCKGVGEEFFEDYKIEVKQLTILKFQCIIESMHNSLLNLLTVDS